MGMIHPGVPRELALALRDAFGLNVFVETGTYKAHTANWAAGNFREVFTIEGYQPYYEANVNAHAGKQRNLHFIFGDSRVELPKVLAQLTEPALIWLDAHWLGNSEESAGTDGECPIREELAALNACATQHFILIDDVHCFQWTNVPKLAQRHLWPDMEEMTKMLQQRGRHVEVVEDVFIAVPEAAASFAKDYARNPGIYVLVPTSNSYLHVLPGFAYLFNRYWSVPQPGWGGQAVTVLRYDIRPPKLPQNFYCPSIGKQSDHTWSGGLKSWLIGSNNPLVLLMLDDYYLTQPVNVPAISELWRYMFEHPEIAKIDLSGDMHNRDVLPYGKAAICRIDGVGVDEAAPDALFQTSIQAAIWRTDFLLRFLNDSENPWQFEKKGGNRLAAAKKAGEFNGLILGVREPLLHYVNAIGGEGHNPGQYDRRKFPPWLLVELEKGGFVR